ncbi:Uncharacterised protein [Vibrio cholerae]|nr:Uncharacterised protein [Vibrio cholerae]
MDQRPCATVAEYRLTAAHVGPLRPGQRRKPR